MSTLLLDMFPGPVDQLLSAHTPSTGGPWTITGGLTPALDGAVDGNKTPWLQTAGVYLDDSGAGSGPFAAGPVHASADCVVSCLLRRYAGVQAGEIDGVVARWNGTTTWVELSWREADGLLYLATRVAGVEVTVQTYAVTLPVGGSLPIKLALTGNNAVVTVGNVEHTPESVAAVPGAGRSGLRSIGPAATASAGMHFEQFFDGTA